MADFETPVVRITKVTDHPNADRLSLIWFRGFAVVSAKLEDGSHRYKPGDLVVYCPQDSVIPDYLLKQGYYQYDIELDFSALDLKFPVPKQTEDAFIGKLSREVDLVPGVSGELDSVKYTVLKTGKGLLAGSKGNRVKPLKLRNILSEGIMFPVVTSREGDQIFNIIHSENDFHCVNEGDNVADFLGITKYEPVIPETMAGDVAYIGQKIIPYFDVENIKKYPDLLQPDDDIIVTEKLHGTFFGIGYVPGLNHPDLWGDWFCYSKGLGKQGLVFKNSENNINNLYVKMFLKILPRLKLWNPQTKFFMLGEIFGKGVQDLHYGKNEPDYRTFDMYSNDSWIGWLGFKAVAKEVGADIVPVVYEGKYSEYNAGTKDGNSVFAKHIKEGNVLKTQEPKIDPLIGRIILKDISDKYHTRKNATEFT